MESKRMEMIIWMIIGFVILYNIESEEQKARNRAKNDRLYRKDDDDTGGWLL